MGTMELLSCKSPVTAGGESMFGGEIGAWEVIMAGGLSSFATGVACEACLLAASLPTRSTLELGHLCLLAVLRDLNFRPHATHCRSRAGEFGHFRGLTFPSRLGSTAPLPCKTPLLLLGIVGLAATRMEIEEGKIALSVKKLQNIYKHHLFHLFYWVRY